MGHTADSSVGEDQPSALKLIALTPQFDRAEHGVYVNALGEAVDARHPPNRNIALTGSYGSGKSSILDEFTRRHAKRVISVSLSTLGALEHPAPEEGRGPVSGVTNRIQKEIVKQLLHSRDPISTPGSRYRRTTRFRWGRELGPAALVALPLTLVAMLTGWTAQVWVALSLPALDGRWGHLAALIALAFFVLGARRVLHNRYQIDQITAGAATIALSKGSGTYFDEYLDEIVYLFESSGQDIVVLEDIDRFDEPEIFETLRSLNILLNRAQQLRGRTVRFVYAIKDSIFDELARTSGSAPPREPLQSEGSLPLTAGKDVVRAEVARANRTKFFDLIIPVVPFLTHQSARDLVAKTMKDLDHGISAGLIDLAAHHVADMRLIKDVRNEFAVFRQQILTSGGLELTDDALFAMVLYKTTHLSDFEAIRLGQSDLDEVYRASRDLTAYHLSRLGDKLRALKGDLRRASLGPADAEEFGDALIDHLERLTAALGATSQSQTHAGQLLDAARARDPDFWHQLASTDVPIQVVVSQPTSGRPYTFSLDRAYLSHQLRIPIETNQWAEGRQHDLHTEIEQATADRDFLAHADMKDLLGRAEFVVGSSASPRSLRQVAEERLRSKMALELLAAGYIDRNFTLYTATFHTLRASAQAMNYIIKNVDPGIIDMHYRLGPDDVETLVRDRPRLLEEPSAYNLCILDVLLKKKTFDLDVLVQRLARYGEVERELLLEYVEAGCHAKILVEWLAPIWPRIFWFILVESGIEKDEQVELVGAALSTVTGAVEYDPADGLAQLLEERGPEFASLASEVSLLVQAEQMAEVVLRSGALMPDLNLLGRPAAQAIAAVGAFRVTRDNLEFAAGSSSSLALDDLAREHFATYKRCLQDLDQYLSTLRGEDVSIRANESFPSVIDAVLEADPSSLEAVLAAGSPEYAVRDLNEVAVAAWPALAAGDRIVATPATLARYFEVIGLDEPLGGLLQRSDVVLTDDDDESVKHAIAVQVMAAVEILPSPALRTRLSTSLNLEAPLAPSEIPREKGNLLALLLAERLVEDGPDAFAVLLDEDWLGRDAAIAASAGFSMFATRRELPSVYIEHFLASDVVPTSTKNIVVERFADLAHGAAPSALTAVAAHAIRCELHLPFDDVHHLAEKKVSPNLVVPLLQPYLKNVEVDRVVALLRIVGGIYAQLTSQNNKHPSFKATPHHRSLVAWAKDQGFASSSNEAGGMIRVHMRRARR